MAVLVISKTPHGDPEDVERAPAASATPAATPIRQDPLPALLAEAKTWPVVLAENFDSATTPTDLSRNFNSEPDSDDTCTRAAGVNSSLDVLNLTATPKAKVNCLVVVPIGPARATTGFCLQVEVQLWPAVAKAGLIFLVREPAAKNFYAFMISKRGYSLAVYKQGAWNPLRLTQATSAIHPARFNSLAVVAVGTDLTLFINDQKVDQLSNVPLSAGRVGVAMDTDGLEPATFDFDNFELRSKSAMPKSH
ncbi:MAG: hypothetical protein WAM82_05545 [Thermoanaerobaculia bacterium]